MALVEFGAAVFVVMGLGLVAGAMWYARTDSTVSLRLGALMIACSITTNIIASGNAAQMSAPFLWTSAALLLVGLAVVLRYHDVWRAKHAALAGIISSHEGGARKRTSENKELLELLQQDAPHLLEQKPWVLSWIRSHAAYFGAVEEASALPGSRGEGDRNSPSRAR
uniref:Uncharacterized protein n=1 Tax=Herbaspirillum huttiense subsp. nephrolepidis TaxID=3075126 RepID=A0AAE4G7Y6_9BURK